MAPRLGAISKKLATTPNFAHSPATLLLQIHAAGKAMRDSRTSTTDVTTASRRLNSTPARQLLTSETKFLL
jgi:hypothetical protein